MKNTVKQAYLQAMGFPYWMTNRLEAKNINAMNVTTTPIESAIESKQPQENFESAPKKTNAVDQKQSIHQDKPPLLIKSDQPTKSAIEFPNQSTSKTTNISTIHKTTNTLKQAIKRPNSQFRLMALSINNQCLLVTEVPHTNNYYLSNQHKDLLKNILQSIHQPWQQEHQNHISEIHWPLGHQGLMAEINQDDHAAFNAVHAFLQKQFNASTRKLLILLGQASARFVVNPQYHFECLRGIHSNLKTQQLIAISYSVHQLLQQPILKKACWQDLRPLNQLMELIQQ